MNYLYATGLSKTYADRQLFENIEFSINKGQKVALIARNGTGKTSLLRVLAGIEQADTGNINRRSGISLGYLEQDNNLDESANIMEAIFATKNPVLQLIKEYEECLFKVERGGGEKENARLQVLMEKMEESSAWDYQQKINEVLTRLDLRDPDQLVKNLSGGQKKRVALASILIRDPEFLILDEPTNHLDIGMIEWLQQHLKTKNTTLLLVSHDRYFLDGVTDEILELEDGKLLRYRGSYAYYLEKKAERTANMQSQVANAKRYFKRELEWIRKQPKARSVKPKARVEAFDDVEKAAKKKVDTDSVKLDIKMERIGSKILEFHNVGKSFGDKNLIEGFSYKFKRFERVGIVGVNGSGKSTLLNMITGSLQPDVGKIVLGDTIKVGYYRQDHADIKPGLRVIEAVREVADFIRMHKGQKLTAYQLLERFLFSKEKHQQLVSTLSGGERRRLHLMRILMENPNFLILDEPTNDLDLATLNVLEDFLAEFSGILVIVTHDRYFMDRLVDHLFIFEGDGVIRDFPGNYTSYQLALKQEAAAVKIAKTAAALEKKEAAAGKDLSRARKLSYNEQREFKKLGREVEDLEKEKSKIETKLAAGPEHEEVMKLSERMGEIVKELDEKENRWLELSEWV